MKEKKKKAAAHGIGDNKKAELKKQSLPRGKTITIPAHAAAVVFLL